MNFLAYSEQIMMNIGRSKNQTHFERNSLSHYGQQTLKRCEKMIEQLDLIKQTMNDFELPLNELDKSHREYYKKIDEKYLTNKVDGFALFEEGENFINKKSSSLKEQLTNYEKILERRIEYLEKIESMDFIEELMPLDMKLQEVNLSSHLSVESSLKNQSQIRFQKRFHTILGLVPTQNFFQL